MVPDRPKDTVIHSLQVWLGFVLFGILLAAAPYSFGNPRFERFAARQGLFQNTIMAIVQDRRGFLWLGTKDGLVKYDGYTFSTFRTETRNSTAYPANFVSSLCLSRTGDLWVAFLGEPGLKRFDIQRESWEDVLTTTRMSSITNLIEDPSGMLWFGTARQGLFKYNPTIKQSEPVNLDPTIKHDALFRIQTLFQDKNGDIWVGNMEYGLYQLNPKTGSVHHYQHNPGELNSLSSNRISCICEDPQGDLWIGTYGGGLNRLTHHEDQVHFIHYPEDQKDNANLNDIYYIAVDRLGQIWIGTERHGVSRLDPQTGQTSHYSMDPRDDEIINITSICAIFEDRSENLWIGSEDNGLFKINQRRLVISHLQKNPNELTGLSSNTVGCIHEDREGTLWIGTWEEGLNRWERTTGRISRFLPEATKPLDAFANGISSIFEDSKGTLWVATFVDKVYHFDRISGRFRLIHSFTCKINFSGIDVLFEDRSGNIWVGTRIHGLIKMNSSGRVLAIYPIKNEINQRFISISAIHEDDSGTLWLGTNVGLFLFNPATAEIKLHDDCLRSKSINCFFKDSTGTLLIGASDGLYQYSPETKSFSSKSRSMGISTCNALCVLEDNHRCLWILTDQRIIHTTPTGRELRIYTVLDGLQSQNSLSSTAFIMTRNGEIISGGANGLDWFCPNDVRMDQPVPPVVITGLQLFNQPVPIEEKAGAILSKRISETDTIILDHRQNVLTFEFAVLNFNDPARCRYAYKMEGFDKDWVSCGARRQATYTNLNPGDYVFRVKGAGEEGVWNETGTSVRVVIRPPFYRTGWFLALLIAGLLMTGGTGYVTGSKLLTKLFERHRATRFGKFRLLKKIGSGGTGEVYLAKDGAGGKTGALKIIHESIMSPKMQTRFLREGLVCESIDHGNITRVMERGTIHGRSYLFMDFVDGPSLQQLIDGRTLRPKHALAITAALLDIVGEIHAHGVIHRDLKPDNILFTREFDPGDSAAYPDLVERVKGSIRILDFGLARFMENQTLTRLDIDTGTPLFLPPEYFWNRQSPDPSVDLYALGIILYLMLTGEAPYLVDHDDVYQTIFRIVNQAPTPPARQNPDIPQALSDFVMTMIEKDVTTRLKDDAELKSKLAALATLV